MIDNKLIAIQKCLENDIDMPTKEIISKILNKYSINVSERYVQKIRKKTKEEKNEIKELVNHMNEEDVFDSGKGLEDWQIELINMANEGDWTVQEIAERLNVDIEPVRKTLVDWHYMITGKVLDEASDSVYYDGVVLNGKDTDKDDETSIFEDRRTGLKIPVVIVNNDDDVPKKEEEFWEVKIDCVTSCSKVEKEIDVFMSKNCRSKAMMFMRWAKSREWLAYLIGEKKEDGYYIHDLYLPDQRTSATLVDKVVAEEYNNLNVVGVIHSHHEMGAGDEDRPSFSGHDDDFINSNHNLSLLAGRDRKTGGFKVVGIARIETPCGGLMKIKANVKAMVETPSEDEEKLKEEFFGKVFGKPNAGLEEKINAHQTILRKYGNGHPLDTRSGQYHF